jgi:hypothetical protein
VIEPLFPWRDGRLRALALHSWEPLSQTFAAPGRVEEARRAALEELIPKSLRVLRVHLGDGDTVNPEAW